MWFNLGFNMVFDKDLSSGYLMDLRDHQRPGDPPPSRDTTFIVGMNMGETWGDYRDFLLADHG